MPSLGPIDRAAHLRKNAGWLRAQLESESTLFVITWRDKNLVVPGEGRVPHPAALSRAEIGTLPLESATFLGLAGERALFSLEAPPDSDAPVFADTRFVDLRMGGLFMPAEEFAPLAYARGMARWNRTTRFCERCGAELTTGDAGFRKTCPAGHETYPRTDPAVMVLVRHADEVLLARQPRFPPGMFSALAGFVELGESLEECVRRETREEVGLETMELRYFGSQGWPFPRSLMVAYEARVATKEFVLEEEELEEARWFTAAELATPRDFFYPPPRSLAHALIRAFVEEYA